MIRFKGKMRLWKRKCRNNKYRKSKGGDRKLVAAGMSILVFVFGVCMKQVGAGQEIEKPEKALSTGADTENVRPQALTKKPVQTDSDYRRKYKTKKAGTVVVTVNANKKQLKQMFYQTKITDAVFQRMYKKSYKKNCTVPRKELRYIRVLYYGFDKKTHIGELVVNKRIAKDICRIFYQLYCKKYPIEKMVLVDEYNAVDEASMAANNTSSFNYRPVSGTARLSKHSYGMAIDINPRYNPYIHTISGKRVCEPVNGKKYANRKKAFAYKIDKKDLCYKLFTKYGFTWGGNWRTVKDYQHFERVK